MPIVDTSVLVAMFNPDDVHRSDALRISKAAAEMVVPQLVLAEFLQVVEHMTRRHTGGAAVAVASRRAYQEVQRGRNVVFHAGHDHAKAAAIYLGNPKLSYIDAAAIQVALSTGQELASFDDDQVAVWKRMR